MSPIALNPHLLRTRWPGNVGMLHLQRNHGRTEGSSYRPGSPFATYADAMKTGAVLPTFRDFMEGNRDEASHGDPVAFVTSENASRRHLNTSQLAHAIAAMAGWEREQAKKRQVAGLKQGDSPFVQGCTNGGEHGRTSEKLAARTGASARTVDKAIKVREAGLHSVGAHAEPGCLARTPPRAMRRMLRHSNRRPMS